MLLQVCCAFHCRILSSSTTLIKASVCTSLISNAAVVVLGDWAGNMRNFLIGMILLFIVSHVSARTVNNGTDSPPGVSTSVTDSVDHQPSVSAIKSRRKRYISQSDMLAIVDYHNQVRARVFPPAANMEYMVSEWSRIHHTPRHGAQIYRERGKK